MAYNPLLVSIFTGTSLGADLVGTPIEVRNQDNVGVSLAWTGTPVGEFSIEASIDYLVDSFGNVVNAGTWVTIPLDPTITAAGTPDDALIDLNQLPAVYIRLVYTRTSGTGTLTASASGKAV